MIWIVLAVIAAATVILPYIDEFFYRRRAKARGCGVVPVGYYHPLGVPDVIRRIKSVNNDTLLNKLQDNCESFSNQTARQQVMGMKWIITFDPENIKSVLSLKFNDYSLGFRWNVFFPMLGNGIFTLSGDGWKHSRALLRPQFARDQVGHLESVKEHVNILMNRFAQTGGPKGEPLDAQQWFHRLTIDTASEFLFGQSSNTLLPNSPGVVGPKGLVTGQMFAESFSRCLHTMAVRLFMGPLYWLNDSFKLRKDIAVCHNLIDYYVDEALKKPMEKNDEADRYVFIKELTKETRDPKIIRDQAFNVLLAGRDTTASLLSYCTFYLGQNKEVYAQLREAVLMEFGTTDENLSFESLKKCKYLQCVINEVLRLHPIVPTNFRTAIKDTILPRGGGQNGDEPVFVPKGTNVFYIPYAMQRHPLYWGEDGSEFKPDRWVEPHQKYHPWAYIPFNGGPRICLGQQFALTEAGLTLVRIAQRFKNIEVLHPNPVTTNPRNMKQWMRLTSSIADGLSVRFEEDKSLH